MLHANTKLLRKILEIYKLLELYKAHITVWEQFLEGGDPECEFIFVLRVAKQRDPSSRQTTISSKLLTLALVTLAIVIHLLVLLRKHIRYGFFPIGFWSFCHACNKLLMAYTLWLAHILDVGWVALNALLSRLVGNDVPGGVSISFLLFFFFVVKIFIYFSLSG